MTDTHKNIIKWLAYIIHILSAIATIVLYAYFLHTDFFFEKAPAAVSLFLGSALVAACFRKTQNLLLKVYFVGLSVVTLAYLGIWIILGLLMMH